MTGSFHKAARLIDSWNAPCLIAPSPRKHKVTLSLLKYLSPKAIPVPKGIWPPTIPWPPKKLYFFEKICIEPPKPPDVPVALPNNSAITNFGSSPKPIAWTWLLYELIILSFLGSMEWRHPARTASWPL